MTFTDTVAGEGFLPLDRGECPGFPLGLLKHGWKEGGCFSWLDGNRNPASSFGFYWKLGGEVRGYHQVGMKVPAPSSTFLDTTLGKKLRRLVIPKWEWKFRLPFGLLLVGIRIEQHPFSVVFHWSGVVNVYRFSVLLGYSFPGPLVREGRKIFLWSQTINSS